MMKTLLISIIALLISVPSTLAQITYNGNGNDGFGGAVGTSSLSINDDGTTISVTITRGTGNFNDDMVMYISNGSSGRTIIDGNVNDNGDDLRRAISNRNSANLVFPSGFEATHAVGISTGFGGLWSIPNSGVIGDDGLGFITGVGTPPNEFFTTFTFNFNWTEIGLTSSDNFGFVITYGNGNDGGNNMFSSDEAYGSGIGAGNPGLGAMTFTSYFNYPDGLVGGNASTAQNGNWSDSATWTNGNVPLEKDGILINHDVNLDQNATVTGLTINTGTFTASDGVARELTISRSAAGSATTITNSAGIWANGTGGSTVVFTGAPSSGDAIHRTSGAIAFQNVTINKTAGTSNVGVDFQSNSSVSGTLKIGNGGFVSTAPPADFYATSAILEFDQGVGAIYDVGATDNSWSTTEIPQNITVSSGTVNLNANRAATGDLIVASDATLNVSAGSNLEINSDLTNSGTIVLNSNSTIYSSLITTSVTNSGTINYNRYVNAAGSGSTGGNDLVSPTLSGQTFGAFATANEGILAASGDVRAFAPFNNAATPTGTYENYNITTDASTLLEAGKGYRAAAGAPLVFTGAVATGIIDVGITSETVTFGKWNLIGNPYPSYLDFALFFDANKTQFNTGAFQAIYGYNAAASLWTIWNQATIDDTDITELIAPGQGFFVNSKDGGGSVSFEPAMRATGSSDDFITGRSTSNVSVARADINLLKGTDTFSTIVYFNSNATRNLDPGYDAGAYTGNASGIFTHLVEGNTGVELAMQVLGYEDFNDVIIPLGIKSVSGENLSISLDQTTNTLPSSVNVYLEDVVNGTFTLLNTDTFEFSPASDLNGTGRFFLRFTNGTLSMEDVTESSLNIYHDQAAQSIVIAGPLSNNSTANLYDLQGRLVNSVALSASQTQHSLDVSALQTGVYIVNIDQLISRKVIIN